MPKKGTRKIQVDGRPYRYVFKNVSDETTLTVQEDAETTGRVLQVNFKRDNAMTPAQVADYVRFAKTKGWDPSESGKAFRIHNGDYEQQIFP